MVRPGRTTDEAGSIVSVEVFEVQLQSRWRGGGRGGGGGGGGTSNDESNDRQQQQKQSTDESFESIATETVYNRELIRRSSRQQA